MFLHVQKCSRLVHQYPRIKFKINHRYMAYDADNAPAVCFCKHYLALCISPPHPFFACPYIITVTYSACPHVALQPSFFSLPIVSVLCIHMLYQHPCVSTDNFCGSQYFYPQSSPTFLPVDLHIPLHVRSSFLRFIADLSVISSRFVPHLCRSF